MLESRKWGDWDDEEYVIVQPNEKGGWIVRSSLAHGYPSDFHKNFSTLEEALAEAFVWDDNSKLGVRVFPNNPDTKL